VTQPQGATDTGNNVQIILNGAIGEKEWFEDNLPPIMQDLSARNVNVGFVPQTEVA
jgi:hypothetical protein